MPHSLMTTGKRADFSQVSGMEINECLGRRVRFWLQKINTLITSQPNWGAPFQEALGTAWDQSSAQLKSRAQIQMSMLWVLPNMPWLPLVCGLLIYWNVWSTGWKCLWWSPMGSPYSTKCFTGNFLFGEVQTKNSAKDCIVQDKSKSCCHLK